MERTSLVWVGHQSVSRIVDTKSIHILFHWLHLFYAAAAWALHCNWWHFNITTSWSFGSCGSLRRRTHKFNSKFCLSWKDDIVVTQAGCQLALKEMRHSDCVALQLFPAFNFSLLGSTVSILMFAVLTNIVTYKVYNTKLKRGLPIGSMFTQLNMWNPGWLQMLLWVCYNIPI